MIYLLGIVILRGYRKVTSMNQCWNHVERLLHRHEPYLEFVIDVNYDHTEGQASIRVHGPSSSNKEAPICSKAQWGQENHPILIQLQMLAENPTC